MKFKSLFAKPFVLLFLGACLSALPLTFSYLFALSWVSFVPLFYVIISKSHNKLSFAIGRGFLFGFCFNVCVYYWFIWFFPLEVAKLTNSASIAVVLLAWLGISAAHGVLWCIPFIASALASRITKNKPFLCLVAILGIIAAQKITALGELSFPWVRISLGQYKATPLIQSAALFGAEGVDMIILAVNALITIALLSSNKKRIVSFGLAAVIFIANLGFGIARLNTAKDENTLTIMTVQASVPQDEKWARNGDKICFDAYSTLTKQNVTDDVQLVLWPESAVPKIYKNVGSLSQYHKLSQEIEAPLLAGIILKTNTGNTNNTALINGTSPVEIYTKRQMVPFGEYMPYKRVFSKLFPSLTKLNIIKDDYVSGNSSTIMSVEDGKLGSIICFESIYPALTRQSAIDGANLIIEATNDSWLETSPAMHQHLAHGVFRSVETNRYIVRSANSGISAVIDNRGNIKSTLGINEQGVITDTVQLIDKQTLYTKTGDVLFPVSCILVLMWAVIIFIKRKKATDN